MVDKNIKVIQVSTTSPSFFLQSGKGNINDILKDDWFSQVGIQIKKSYPKMNVECWTIEKNYKKEQEVFEEGIKFRAFPSIFSVRPGMDLSTSMVSALKKEKKRIEKEGGKLILHFHEHHSWEVYLILLMLDKKNLKIISQHHGGRNPFANLMKYKRLFLFLPLIILMQFCEYVLFRKVDRFYSLSKEEDNYLSKIVPKSKIKFQTMGISNEYFKKQDKLKARKKLGLDKNKKYVLYLGRIRTTKGISELLDAIQRLKDKDIQLLLVGEGRDFERYKNYVKSNKIKNIKFLGAIYGKEKLDYLSASDCLILPSHTEGAPVVLMEAIAKNLPVIATNVGGVEKMIKNKREGIIIPINSRKSIIKSINEVLSWKKKNISQYGKKYKWDEIINDTIMDYSS